MEHTGGTLYNSTGLKLLREGEPIIPFIKGIHDKPFELTININTNNKSEEEMANIIKEALKGCV